MFVSFLSAKSQSYLALISVCINNSRNNYDISIDFSYIKILTNFKYEKWTLSSGNLESS